MRVKIDGIWLDVDYEYHRPIRGQRDSMGVPLTPDEPEEVGLTAVMVGDRDILPRLDIEMMRRIEEEVLKGSGEWMHDL